MDGEKKWYIIHTYSGYERKVAESLMRAHGVVGSFPVLEFAVELGEGEREGGDLIELLCVGAVSAFDPAVELGGAGRQDKELDAALQASLLEEGGELATAIHLQGAQGKGQTAFEGIEKQLGRRGGGPAVYFDHIPARDHIPSRELLQHHPRCWPQVHRVELDEVTGPFDRIIPGLAQCPGTMFGAASSLHPKPHRILERSPLAQRIVATLREQRVTVVAGVPPLWGQLLDTHAFTEQPIPSLRILTNAGGKLPVAAVRALRTAQPQARASAGGGARATAGLAAGERTGA